MRERERGDGRRGKQEGRKREGRGWRRNGEKRGRGGGGFSLPTIEVVYAPLLSLTIVVFAISDGGKVLMGGGLEESGSADRRDQFEG